jgi:hypothetical protein
MPDYEAAINEIKQSFNKDGHFILRTGTIPAIRDLITGTETLLKLEEAITIALTEDEQNELTDQHKILTGEAAYCPKCGYVTDLGADDECENAGEHETEED